MPLKINNLNHLGKQPFYNNLSFMLHIRYIEVMPTFILILSNLSFGNTFKKFDVQNHFISNSYYTENDSMENEAELLTITDYIIKPLIYIYREFISKYDGDNCPFEPSCSNFLIVGLRKINFIEAILIFSDRLTRDFNVFNRKNYPLSNNGKLLDPFEKYFFDKP